MGGGGDFLNVVCQATNLYSTRHFKEIHAIARSRAGTRQKFPTRSICRVHKAVYFSMILFSFHCYFFLHGSTSDKVSDFHRAMLKSLCINLQYMLYKEA